jgi:asparagine synthetase B (glutamine-hydrolysing)
MSAIGGIYSRNGSALDRTALPALAKGLAEMGPDGHFFFLQPPVGMVFCAFYTDSESRRTPQPVATPQGNVLAWNGRLDNRRELERALRDLSATSPRACRRGHKRSTWSSPLTGSGGSPGSPA